MMCHCRVLKSNPPDTETYTDSSAGTTYALSLAPVYYRTQSIIGILRFSDSY